MGEGLKADFINLNSKMSGEVLFSLEPRAKIS